MSKCERCLKVQKRPGVCALCQQELVAGVEQARQIWEYSEPRIREHRGESDYKLLREEGYNLLLYSLLDALRLSRYNGGRRTTSRLVSGSEWQQVVQAITSFRSTVNNNRFIGKRFEYLVDAEYVKPVGTDLYELAEHEPYCAI